MRHASLVITLPMFARYEAHRPLPSPLRILWYDEPRLCFDASLRAKLQSHVRLRTVLPSNLLPGPADGCPRTRGARAARFATPPHRPPPSFRHVPPARTRPQTLSTGHRRETHQPVPVRFLLPATRRRGGVRNRSSSAGGPPRPRSSRAVGGRQQSRCTTALCLFMYTMNEASARGSNFTYALEGACELRHHQRWHQSVREPRRASPSLCIPFGGLPARAFACQTCNASF